MNLNKVLLIGNLTRDPEMRSLASGQSLATFAVATNRVWTDKQGQRQQQAEYHNIVMFGRLAEIAQQYLTKGKLVFIEGRIQTRSWDAQDGTKKYRTEIVAETMQLGPRGAGGNDAPREESRPQQQPTHNNVPKAAEEDVDTVQYPDGTDEVDPNEIPF